MRIRARDAASPIPWSEVWFRRCRVLRAGCRATAHCRRTATGTPALREISACGHTAQYTKSTARSAPPRRHVRAARPGYPAATVRKVYYRVTKTRVGRIHTRAP